MGVEYEDIKLVDVYNKTNPHKVKEKYGKMLIVRVDFNF